MKIKVDFTRKGFALFIGLTLLILISTNVIMDIVPFEYSTQILLTGYLLAGFFAGSIVTLLIKTETPEFGSSWLKVTKT